MKISELPTSVNHVWFRVINDVIRDVWTTLGHNNLEIRRIVRQPIIDAIGGLVHEIK